jgi:hypothetical protein
MVIHVERQDRKIKWEEILTLSNSILLVEGFPAFSIPDTMRPDAYTTPHYTSSRSAKPVRTDCGLAGRVPLANDSHYRKNADDNRPYGGRLGLVALTTLYHAIIVFFKQSN